MTLILDASRPNACMHDFLDVARHNACMYDLFWMHLELIHICMTQSMCSKTHGTRTNSAS